ncbi:MAG: phosphoribosyltransferase domain-containing protein [Intestinibacter sp.]
MIKRRFLFVSKVLGKHLPCRACDMDNLGKDIVKVYEKARLLKIRGYNIIC